MKDYVNVGKPTSFQFWMNKYGEHVKFGFFVLVMAIIG
jgi:hypothetical protein